ncbi:LPS export ABC transporter periplasmic protein LptC [Castellaniella sp. S9]|uniref:LPS export ABC transporter periplasmic protein LptC n=1 Tax=Castellaniella sp. S9 TaxID=2993652 RepID=UPI0022B53111|nr:LPS export ABC transporter periplasmic protein LptC [Castellaniella sp. S9]
MKERFPSLVAVLLLALLVIGTWWASDYTLRSIEIDPPRRITHERDSWSDHFVMVRTDPQGLAINRLEGSAMEHFPDTDAYEVTQPQAVSHHPGSPVTVGTSDHATMDQNGERIVMVGHAHLKRLPDAEHKLLDVRSERLVLKPDQDLVYTDQPALVVNGQSTMRGTGMRYDNRSRQLMVYSSSDVKISGEEQGARTTTPRKTSQP